MNNVTVAGLAESIPLADIESALSKALDAGKDPGQITIRPARMSNLVIFCEGPEQAAWVQNALPGMVAVHPARILLAIQDAGDGDGPVRGSVNVWCAVGDGREHICSEQITLRTTARGLDHLPFAVRGLLTGDLPTNLWWASTTPPALAGPVLHDLAAQAQQIVYDSIGWPDPARGVAATASWLAGFERAAHHGVGWRVAADLNWRRLKYWRRVLAQALDPNSAPGALESISEVLIEHGPHAVIQAWELVSWLASRLGWHVQQGRVQPGVEFAFQVRAPHSALAIRINRLPEGRSEIRRVRITCRLEGQPVAILILPDTPQRLAITLQGRDVAPRLVSVPQQTLEDLVARQLSDRERDPVFRESMVVAQIFAQSLL